MTARKKAQNPLFTRLAEFLDTSARGNIVTFCADGSQNCSFFASVETGIRLASLTAEAANGDVLVSWTTGSETRNLGFNVYRSTGINGQRTLVNGEMVAAQGRSGGNYSLTDTAPGSGRFFANDVERKRGGLLGRLGRR